MVAPLRPPERPLTDPGEHLWIWQAGQPKLRIFHMDPRWPELEPRRYGPLGRFDPHLPDEQGQPQEQPDGRGVVYLADTLGTALAEAFQTTGADVAVCPFMHVIAAEPIGPVPLVDLTGAGAMRIGTLTALSSTSDRELSQAWGKAIYEDLPELPGIRYRGAHDSGVAVALFDGAPALAVASAGGPFGLWEPNVRERVEAQLASQGRHPVGRDPEDCQRCRAAGFV